MRKPGKKAIVHEGEPLLLTEVTLERFKAAFKPKPIELGRFNVIIGRNGSGKSTLLEAIQWLDTTIRRDAREACDRYFGSADLVNLRSKSTPQYFKMKLRWGEQEEDKRWSYQVKIVDQEGIAEIAEENLCELGGAGRVESTFVETRAGERWVYPEGEAKGAGRFPVLEPDRLALPRATVRTNGAGGPAAGLERISAFWERAVFLRLSPHELARGAPARRKSYEPLLDEAGQTLPSLLAELTAEQRASLVANVQEVLPGIMGVEVSEAEVGRDTRVHYNLLEQMPYVGRSGRKKFPIPAWMLSEGTRRITAILALLAREPRPTFLCIEEVENGLDPWTVRLLLAHLQSAADEGVQVVVTTHSPWLLDSVPMGSIIQVQRVDGNSEYMRFADRPEVRAFGADVPAGTRYVQLQGEG